MKPVIFGQHDEATIRQIETCLAAGGEKAVLCADGHKGYAQPIGGVVAYKDKVSISGVGFDIACGTGGFLLTAHDYIAKHNALDRAQKKRLKSGSLFGI